MTVFAKRRLNVTDWAPIQEKIGALQMSLGAPHGLMMFLARSDERMKDDIFIGLPDAKMLSLFPGFEAIDRADLPDYLSTLVVREDGFADTFPDIAAKRRSKSR